MCVQRWDYLMVEVCKLLLFFWVMDKYGEFYSETESWLLGMDKAALDFSDARKRKPKKKRQLPCQLCEC